MDRIQDIWYRGQKSFQMQKFNLNWLLISDSYNIIRLKIGCGENIKRNKTLPSLKKLMVYWKRWMIAISATEGLGIGVWESPEPLSGLFLSLEDPMWIAVSIQLFLSLLWESFTEIYHFHNMCQRLNDACLANSALAMLSLKITDSS